MPKLNPDPYQQHPDGPWHARAFPVVVAGVTDLLRRYRAGDVEERTLLHGKDNGSDRKNVLSHWLYYQHHPGHEVWKCLGQPYWSEAAYASWRDQFFSVPESKRYMRNSKIPHLATFPKAGRKKDNPYGLVSEHVVPKAVIKRLLLDRGRKVEDVLRLNICAVITKEEDDMLPRHVHHDPFSDLWQRYRNSGIRFVENSLWTTEERTALIEAGLIERIQA